MYCKCSSPRVEKRSMPVSGDQFDFCTSCRNEWKAGEVAQKQASRDLKVGMWVTFTEGARNRNGGLVSNYLEGLDLRQGYKIESSTFDHNSSKWHFSLSYTQGPLKGKLVTKPTGAILFIPEDWLEEDIPF